MSEYKDYIMTNNAIVFIYKDKDPISIIKTQPIFEELCQLINDGQPMKAAQMADIGGSINEQITEGLSIQHGIVFIDGIRVGSVLTNKILQFYNNEEKLEPLVNFFRKAKLNPEPKSIEGLFKFLDKNHVPITPSGNIIAYKRVRDTWFDFHSNSIKSEIGIKTVMDRKDCNLNPEDLCSVGLHVSTYLYTEWFKTQYGDKGITLEVEVHPADVIAIPKDHNEQKMRTCGYTPIKVVDGEYSKLSYDPKKEKRKGKKTNSKDRSDYIDKPSKHKIYRLSKHQKRIETTPQREAILDNDLLCKFNRSAGDIIWAAIVGKKRKYIRIFLNKRDVPKDISVRPLKVSAHGCIIPRKVFKEANMSKVIYTASAIKGALEIK